jgi:hypothetical protein
MITAQDAPWLSPRKPAASTFATRKELRASFTPGHVMTAQPGRDDAYRELYSVAAQGAIPAFNHLQQGGSTMQAGH